MAFALYTDGLYSAAQLKAALDEGVMRRRLRWAFGAEHPTAHSLFHPDGSTQLDRRRMEKETAAHVSPGKPAGTEQHFIAAASPARAPRGAQAQGWARPQPGAGGWCRGTAGAGARAGHRPSTLPGAFVPPMRSASPGSWRSLGQTFLPTHGARVRAAPLRAARVPESSRVPGGAAPAAAPAAEDAPLPAQSEPAVVWKRERGLRWAAWEQLRCRAQGTRSPGEGSGGLEPAGAAAPGLGRLRGRLVVSLPHWSRRGHCNSSQGGGCSAQPPSTGCGPAQPHAFPAWCLRPHASRETLGIAAAPPKDAAMGHSPDCMANSSSPQSSSVPQGVQSCVPAGRPCAVPGRVEEASLWQVPGQEAAEPRGSLPPTLPCSTASSVAWPWGLGL